MGQAGTAEAAVRYLRSGKALAVEALPRPELRCVREDERAPVDPAEFRRVLGNFATGVTVVTAPGAPGEEPAGFACQSFSSSPSTHRSSPSWWAVRRRPGRASPGRASSA